MIKLTSYLKETGRKQVGLVKEDSIGTNSKMQAYDALNSTTLTAVLLFNRRQQGETSKMMASDYTYGRMSRCFCKVPVKCRAGTMQNYNQGRAGWKTWETVPVSFTAEIKMWIDILLEERVQVGTPAKQLRFCKITLRLTWRHPGIQLLA